ncbi:MAG: hypothetical protein ACRDM7_10640 [Thermoleophilaceae bacterium]
MLLYLDQNYLSGIAKRKRGFRELEPVLRDAVGRGAVQVPESSVHRVESAARPDLGLLELLRDLSGGLDLGDERGAAERRCENALRSALRGDYPNRPPAPSDDRDIEALLHGPPTRRRSPARPPRGTRSDRRWLTESLLSRIARPQGRAS